MKNKNNTKYICTQGLFWMLYCVANGYAMFYLDAEGFSTFVIGIMTMAFCVLAAIAGPVIGRISDKTEGGWKKNALILILIAAASYVLLVLPLGMYVKAALFGIGSICVSCVMPLINQIPFFYSARGEKMDFGTARGMGSFAYAVCSMILGKLTLISGAYAVALAGFLISVVMFLLVYKLPVKGYELQISQKEESVHTSIKDFFGRYRFFLVVFMAINLLMIMHMMTNNYMLYICSEAGGDSVSMGIALAIAAVFEIPVMLVFSKLINRFSSVALLLFAAVFFCTKSVLYCVGTSFGSLWVIYIAQGFQMLSFAVYANASVYFSDEMMGEKDKSMGQSIMSCSMIIGQVIGNLVGGVLVDRFSAFYMCMAGLAFCMFGTVLMFACYHKYKSKIMAE